MKSYLTVVALTTLLLIVSSGQILGEECDSLRSASPESLVSFLEANPTSEDNAECFTFAIQKLGEKRYNPAIPALAKLLDFRRPPDEHEKRGYYIRMRDSYPAVDALFEIGKDALPSVLEVIKTESTSALVRENAVSVWMDINRNETPKAVARLRQEADKASDAAKQNLEWALSKALTWCSPTDAAQCKAAAKSGQMN
jgi:hypothetical protein